MFHSSHPAANAATICACLLGMFAAPLPVAAQTVKFDVNDVSFLFPVPTSKTEAEALISLADDAADGPILPESIFKALMKKALEQPGISFPDELKAQFEDPKTWKVAGIRVNPSALGASDAATARAEVPGIRLIVQPVTVEGEAATPHDFAAHVVFNFILPPQTGQPIKPDKEAFGKIVDDLRQIKLGLGAAQATAGVRLNVHPGFGSDPAPLTNKLKVLIKNRLAQRNLDKNQFAAISFMGIPGGFEPWVFFKVGVDTTAGTVAQVPISGVFAPPQPQSQKVSFVPDIRGKVIPAPSKPTGVSQVSTSLLFPTVPVSRLDEPLFPAATEDFARRLKLRDVADLVANPNFTSTTTTDCVSCHTETTRRQIVPNLTSQTDVPGIRFVPATGISGVADIVVPNDRWNVRDFGWGFNFDSDDRSDANGFMPTVTQRAANEAAESADFINRKYLNP